MLLFFASIVLIAMISYRIMTIRVFGALPSGDEKTRVTASPQYRNGSFQNQSDTPVMTGKPGEVFRAYLSKKPNAKPPRPLPYKQTDLAALPDSEVSIVWFGHSSYYINFYGVKLLIDPVFASTASPFSSLGPKSYPGTENYHPEDFPPLDAIILSHDHYDHLDYQAIMRLKVKTGHFYCPLGVAAHLYSWGIARQKISEMDWNDTAEIVNGMKLTAVPARHFSGRLFKRGQSLWASYVLEFRDKKIYLGGDSGYDAHFKKIGAEFGPFDLAILECGQYNPFWKHIHMMPEEVAQAAIDLQAKALMPVHWGRFTLSLHAWDEPIRRLIPAAESLHIPLVTPMIGEIVSLGKDQQWTSWWEKV